MAKYSNYVACEKKLLHTKICEIADSIKLIRKKEFLRMAAQK